jgi:hypothetical protein
MENFFYPGQVQVLKRDDDIRQRIISLSEILYDISE